MKYLVAAAALAVLAASPASAAKMKMSCAADGPSKMTTSMMSMPEGPQRWKMTKAHSAMNTAMSKGDMRGCNKAMRMAM